MPRTRQVLLAAGLVPLPWFLFWTIIGALFAPGYNSISQHASELLQFSGAPNACVRIAAIGAGVAFIGFAAGLWLVTGRLFALGAICWLVFGLSMVTNGIWPLGHPMHGFYSIGITNLIAPTMSHIESKTWPNYRRAYVITALISFAGIVYLWLNLVGADPDGFRGLTQRVFSSINSLWPFLVTLFLLRSSTTQFQGQPTR